MKARFQISFLGLALEADLKKNRKFQKNFWTVNLLPTELKKCVDVSVCFHVN